MLRAMDSAVAGLRAHQNKMDVVGHNIANVNTFGFKAQTYTFKEAMYQTSTSSTAGASNSGGINAAQYGYGALMGTIGMDMTASTPTYVGGFNASISGDGFFLVKATKDTTATPDDFKGKDFLYTRVGQFSLDSNGYVVDGDGNFVYGFPSTYTAGTGGAAGTWGFDDSMLRPIRMVPDTWKPGDDPGFTYDEADVRVSKNISINSAGEIMASIEYDNNGKADTATVSLGKLAIITFQNPNGLSKAGGNYYKTNSGDNTGAAAATVAGGANPDLMTGYVEASNVDLAKEFSDMITTHRGFQSNTKMITVSDEMLSDLVSMKR